MSDSVATIRTNSFPQLSGEELNEMVSLTWLILDQHGDRVLGFGSHMKTVIDTTTKIQLQEYLCDVCDEITTDEETVQGVFDEVFPLWLEFKKGKSDE